MIVGEKVTVSQLRKKDRFDSWILAFWYRDLLFWDTFWSLPSDPSSCIIPYGDLISCGFFISFHKNTHAPELYHHHEQSYPPTISFCPLEKGSLRLKYNRSHINFWRTNQKLDDHPNWTYVFFLNTCSTWRRCPFIVSASTYPRCYFSLHQACFVERSQCWSRAQKVSWKELVGSWPGVWLERAKKQNMMGVKILVGVDHFHIFCWGPFFLIFARLFIQWLVGG